MIRNKFYEEYCGNDYKDWINLGTFKIEKVYGEGIGTEIAED